MNYLVLWSAGRLSNIYTSLPRLTLASGFGSVYSLVAFLPGTSPLFCLPFKLLLSFIMIAIAYAPVSLRSLAVLAGFFYFTSFTLGGMVLGFTYLLHTNAGIFEEIKGIPFIISRHFWSGILLALTFAWVIYRTGISLLRKRITQIYFKISICFLGRRIEVKALVDTGNNLSDPLTGEPVIVVEYEALRPILPEEISNFLEQNDFNLLTACTNSFWVKRLRIIPFQSLGQQHGLLIGIRPDAVEIDQDGKKVTIEKAVIGIYRHRLHEDEDYQALLPPVLVKAT